MQEEISDKLGDLRNVLPPDYSREKYPQAHRRVTNNPVVKKLREISKETLLAFRIKPR